MYKINLINNVIPLLKVNINGRDIFNNLSLSISTMTDTILMSPSIMDKLADSLTSDGLCKRFANKNNPSQLYCVDHKLILSLSLDIHA